MTVGERIRERRQQLGLSMAELGKKLGITAAAVSRYELGQREININTLQRIADALGIHMLDLTGVGDDLEKYATDLTPPIPDIRQMYEALTAEEMARFWEVIHGDKPAKKAPSDLSEEALKIAKDYHELDQPGKNVVKVVIAEEGKRVQAEKERRQVAASDPAETRYIPLYYTPAAAGMTSPAAGQDYDYIEVGSDVPRQADFAVRIDGESMEPYIRDNSIVYVNREPLENGDVGIFYVDGDMLCKQYYKDDYGNVHLLSLNRNYSQADRFIHAKDNDTVMTYYGRVILPRRPLISLV